MKRIQALIMYEFKSLERMKSFIFILFSIILAHLLVLNSKTLQFIILMAAPVMNNLSYYHYISFYSLIFIISILCMLLMSDAVYRDITDERIRLVITKVKRYEYILSKFISRTIMIFVLLLILVLITTFYSFFRIGNAYLVSSLNIFAAIFLMSVFLLSLFLLVSTFLKNPMFFCLLLIMISVALNQYKNLSFMSFLNYIPFGIITIKQVLFFTFGTLFALMTNILLFKRKKL